MSFGNFIGLLFKAKWLILIFVVVTLICSGWIAFVGYGQGNHGLFGAIAISVAKTLSVDLSHMQIAGNSAGLISVILAANGLLLTGIVIAAVIESLK